MAIRAPTPRRLVSAAGRRRVRWLSSVATRLEGPALPPRLPACPRAAPRTAWIRLCEVRRQVYPTLPICQRVLRSCQRVRAHARVKYTAAARPRPRASGGRPSFHPARPANRPAEAAAAPRRPPRRGSTYAFEPSAPPPPGQAQRRCAPHHRTPDRQARMLLAGWLDDCSRCGRRERAMHRRRPRPQPRARMRRGGARPPAAAAGWRLRRLRRTHEKLSRTLAEGVGPLRLSSMRSLASGHRHPGPRMSGG
eukprot:scaffold7222_cov535-Prasinococcus_capsulatus_cf.AAC.13